MITEEQAEWYSETLGRLIENASSGLAGNRPALRLTVMALLSGGHILLEGMPGTGKARLARSLAYTVQASYSEVQCTSDLLPSDLTGVTVFDQSTQSFAFHPGPVFANLVLVKSLTSAPPRTQSALQEVMEHHQVTADGVAHSVPEPFIVVATTSPVELSGSYEIPLALLDRFMIRSEVGYLAHQELVEMIDRWVGADGYPDVEPLIAAEAVNQMRSLAREVVVSPDVLQFVASFCDNLRNTPDVRSAVSNRAAIQLLRLAQVSALSEGRTAVSRADVREHVIPVLAHRISITPDASFAGSTAVAALSRVLSDLEATP